MLDIDTRTAMALISMMSLLMAFVLFAMRRSYPASIGGLGTWASGLAVLVAGSVFAASRGHVPLFFSTALPNFLLCTGVYLLYAGTRRLLGMPAQHRPWMTAISLVTLATMWFTWVDPNYAMRLRLVSTLMTIQYATHAWLLLRSGPMTLAKGLASTVLVVDTSASILRVALGWSLGTQGTVLDNAPQQALYVAVFTLSVLLFSISAILMAGDRLHAELEKLAIHDPLTDALTRRFLAETYQHELSRCQRNNEALTLIMLDVDHFKQINDQHGHPVGDQVLIRLVRHIQSRLRSSDLLARFGGEEFTILLPGTDQNAALDIAERLRQSIEDTADVPTFTVSMGVAVAQPGASTPFEVLIREADQALYVAKAQGRNRVELAQTD